MFRRTTGLEITTQLHHRFHILPEVRTRSMIIQVIICRLSDMIPQIILLQVEVTRLHTETVAWIVAVYLQPPAASHSTQTDTSQVPHFPDIQEADRLQAIQANLDLDMHQTLVIQNFKTLMQNHHWVKKVTPCLQFLRPVEHQGRRLVGQHRMISELVIQLQKQPSRHHLLSVDRKGRIIILLHLNPG
jgi:hypothetical protein